MTIKTTALPDAEPAHWPAPPRFLPFPRFLRFLRFLRLPRLPRSPQATVLLVALGIAAVGIIDHVTGVNVHVFSLYFMPLALAGARLGLRGAVVASLVTTGVWLGVQLNTDLRYAGAQVWALDFFIQGAGFLAVGLLCARMSEALQRERARSQIDSETGLRNRQAFLDDAQGALSLCRRHRRPVALAFIDLLPGLPAPNAPDAPDAPDAADAADAAGAAGAAGDAGRIEMLRRCGQYLQWSLRASDILGRVSEQGFGVLMPEADDQHASVLMARIRAALEGSETLQQGGVSVNISIVIDAVAHSDAADLLQLASAELVQARRAGLQEVCVAVAADMEPAWAQREP